jgi:outer membrane protein assembly factor BamB
MDTAIPRPLIAILLMAGLGAGEAAPAWPCWRGPEGSGAATPCGKPLVDDLADARVVWRSQEQGIPANAWQDVGTHGGYDSPIVAEGKVFLSYFVGSGDIRDTSVDSKGDAKDDGADGGKDAKNLRQCQAVAAEYTVLCADAATGKTLWKKAVGEGINMYTRRKRPGVHHSACWHDGKVYAQTTLGIVHCLDAKDGKELWKSPVPKTAELEKILAAYKKAAKVHPYRGVEPAELKGVGIPYSFLTPLTVAGGVLVADGGGMLIGLDAATGKEAWQKPYLAGHQAPRRWVAQGKELLIVGKRCVEPKTGAEVWNIPDAVGSEGAGPAIGEGYIVLSSKAGLHGYAIDAKGFKPAWTAEGLQANIAVGVISRGWFYGQMSIRPTVKREGGDEVEQVIGIELATGKRIGPLILQGVSQTLGTSLVATDGRLFGHAGAGYSGMFMVEMDPAKFAFAGLRLPTNKSFMPLPGGTKAKDKLDYCICTTPAIVDGRMYYRGSDSLYCLDLRKP